MLINRQTSTGARCKLDLRPSQHVEDASGYRFDAHQVFVREWQQFAGLGDAILDNFEWLMSIEYRLVDLLDLLLDLSSLLVANLRVLCEWTPERRLRVEMVGGIANGAEKKHRGELLEIDRT